MIARALAISLAVLGTASAAAASCGAHLNAKVDIYPTATELPENLLRAYLYFPRAMALTEGVQSVTLLDAQGAPVDGAFLPTNQELWSPDRRRLTVLLDPGRVKSGLAAHEALGRALTPGQSYSLVVSGNAIDAEGCTLGSDSKHDFSVVEADLEPPDPATWTFSQPRAGSKEPITVDLGSPHDHLSMAYRLRVLDEASSIVPGAISLRSAETSWQFTPQVPWQKVRYTLVIDERLEDLAGNRPGALFDRPVSAAPISWKDRWSFVPEGQ